MLKTITAANQITYFLSEAEKAHRVWQIGQQEDRAAKNSKLYEEVSGQIAKAEEEINNAGIYNRQREGYRFLGKIAKSQNCPLSMEWVDHPESFGKLLIINLQWDGNLVVIYDHSIPRLFNSLSAESKETLFVIALEAMINATKAGIAEVESGQRDSKEDYDGSERNKKWLEYVCS